MLECVEKKKIPSQFFFFSLWPSSSRVGLSSPSRVSYLSGEALSVEEVLRTLVVLAPEVEAHLLQPVAVAQGAAGDVHQVGFVRPQRHVLPRVVHGASHLGRKHKRAVVTHSWQASLLIATQGVALDWSWEKRVKGRPRPRWQGASYNGTAIKNTTKYSF